VRRDRGHRSARTRASNSGSGGRCDREHDDLGKGGRAQQVGWETKTARLLPRLLHNRSGPLFLANIAPAPARQPALADTDPDSGPGPALLPPRRRDVPGGQQRLDAAPTTPSPA